MVATGGVFDFSRTIETHAYVVGVTESIAILLPLLFVIEIYENPWFSQLQEVRYALLIIAVFATVLMLKSTLFFWIGFLKRVRRCLMFFLVFLVLRTLAQALILCAAVYYLKFSMIVLSLIGLAFHAYKVLVVIQLRESMLNAPMSIFEKNLERLEDQISPEKQKAEMQSEMN